MKTPLRLTETQTVQALLNQISRCRNSNVVFLIGVLADALDESGSKYAKRVRNLYTRHLGREEYATSADFSKRRVYSRTVYIAGWRRSLRSKIGRVFGRHWRYHPVSCFI